MPISDFWNIKIVVYSMFFWRVNKKLWSNEKSNYIII